ncbi:hypothetical protein OH809_24785 [Streptomyces sp. NBC_00873]|uniref:hypothetical protein n=1 Tax=Streptomyces sp. NBC_00873 TaxID=2975852 RepID=UPI00386F13EC|nr:hypothetical protein OH809_24785 [Streptomyces sp. NBC_00873]
MRRTTTALIATAMLAALAGCSSSSDDKTTAASPATTVTASTEQEHTIDDCVAVIEQDYAQDNLHDASDEAECIGLTEDEYTDAVAEVIGGHKDEILDDAANETAWDTAWDEMDADAQADICSALQIDDPAVAELLTEEQAQYFLDNKC